MTKQKKQASNHESVGGTAADKLVERLPDPREFDQFARFVLGQIGIVQTNPYQETRVALRRSRVSDNQKIYTAVMKRIGGQIQYCSVPHLCSGLGALCNDIYLTLGESIKAVLASPSVKELVEVKLGKGKTIEKFVVDEVPEKDREEFVDALTEFKNAYAQDEKYIRAITEYAVEKKKLADDVIESPEDMAFVITRAYGSIRAYKTKREQLMRKSGESIGKLENLVEKIIPSLDKNESLLLIGVSLGVDVPYLQRIAQEYVKDMALFARACHEEKVKIEKAEIRRYENAAKKAGI